MVLTNYDIYISDQYLRNNVKRLTNQLWKLIPMREHEENWQKQLETVTIEIAGLGQIIFDNNPSSLQLLSKLEGLKIVDTSFETYRRTVFEAINLLQGLLK